MRSLVPLLVALLLAGCDRGDAPSEPTAAPASSAASDRSATDAGPAGGPEGATSSSTPPGFSPHAAGWTHTVTVFDAGTRSERREGRLAWRGEPLDGGFAELVTPIGRFTFRAGRWGDVNWLVTSGPDGGTALARVSGDATTAESIARGWVESTWPAVGPGTPGHWAYSVRLGLWFDPARAAAVLRERGEHVSDGPSEVLPPASSPCYAGHAGESWQAWIDRMPPGPARLVVVGDVRLARPTCRAKLVFAEMKKIEPPILVLRVEISEEATDGPTEVRLQYSSTGQNVGSIEVVLPDGAVQVIDEIGEAR